MAIRVYQIAKEYSKTSEEVMDILREAGIEVSSHTAVLDQHALHTVQARIGKFKLSVVDGDTEQSLEQKKEEPSKKTKATKKTKPAKKKATTRARKKKQEPPATPPKSLKVRIIMTKEEEEEAGQEDVKPVVEETEDQETKATTPPKPRLRRPRRDAAGMQEKLTLIQQKIAARRSGAKAPAAEPELKAGDKSPAKPKGKPPVGDPATKRQVAARPKGYRPDTTRPKVGDARSKKVGRPKGPLQSTDLAQAFRGKGRIGVPVMAPPMGAPGAAAKTPPRLRQPGALKPLRKKKKKKKKRVEKIDRISRMSALTSKVELPKEELGIIMLSEGVTVKELAEKVHRQAKDVIKRLFEKGVMATLNDVLNSDLAIDVAKDFGYLAEIVSFEEDLQLQADEELSHELIEEDLVERAPIVTIMGHVDHGKTSLLDFIRSTRVASGEAGGITQHIGAYSVTANEKEIVFLDTPGHEAFTKMRARGTSVTDIVLLVIAADDGVKPQTVEAINHAKAAKVPIIITINKIDKPEANPDRVKTLLTEHDLVVEDFGGDSPCVLVSAKTGEGIQDLLEMILLVSEMKQLRANPGKKAQGTVIEAKLDRGRGPVATVLVQDGTIHVGDYFITGSTYGKVRAMTDDRGALIQESGPSTPVEIFGLHGVPLAGDTMQVVEDEVKARQISSFRQEKQREEKLRRSKHMSLDQLFSKMKQGEVKELPLIVKSDVQGSIEGISQALDQMKSDKVHLRVIHEGVGNVTENDVLLAIASDAIIIGFNVKVEPKAQDLANHENIDIRLYSVIYEISKEIEEAMIGMLNVEYQESSLGRLVVRQTFQVPKLGKVAGCYVESGVVKRDSKARVLRGQEELFKGDIATLRRFRDDVSEVKSGYECGVALHGFDAFQEEDVLEIFELVASKPTEL